MNKNKIAHTGDLHIRFGSRHEEYATVFERTVKDIQKEQPRRIVITGDLFHLKISLSPLAIELASKFLSDLSKIAPVDIIVGNHDFNEQDLNQGNTIRVLMLGKENYYIIDKNTKKIPIPENGYGVYFYNDSGFYDIDDELVYGVYSLWDHEILTLSKKEPGKKYVALYHGPVYGCMSDNGFQLKGDELIKITAFNNFDIVMLGDIHEYQAFERNGVESAAYSSSLLQQNFGESLNKGYLMWNLDTCTHEQRFIPNDYGYSKLNISQGENVWERIDDSLQLSFNPRKTKVFIELEDNAENESVELKTQIKKYIKSKYKCESVEVEFKKIIRDKILGANTDNLDLNDTESFNKLLSSWMDDNGYDNKEDVLELSNEIDKLLNLRPPDLNHIEWDLNKMITYNILSHPATETVFDFDELGGLTGIFGKNFNGKSNIIKILVWGLYEKLLGGGESHKVVNMYTGIKNAYVIIFFTAAGVRFKSKRGITVSLKKDGTTKAAYSISYEYEDINDSGEKEWVPVESDRAVKEKPEIKKLIVDALGTFENFTKVSLQTQGGKDDYLSLTQQPKNDLIREYMNLSPCDLRHEAVNKKFNQIKLIQKNLGDTTEIEKNLETSTNKIKEEKENVEKYNKEKEDTSLLIDKKNEEILSLAKDLVKVEVPVGVTEESLNKSIELEEIKGLNLHEEKLKLSSWLDSNFKKDIPEGLDKLDMNTLNKNIETEREVLKKGKEDYVKAEKWLAENKKETELNTKEAEEKIDKIKEELLKLKNELLLTKGEKCPTCGHIKHQANIEKEKECLANIKTKEEEVTLNQTFIKNQKAIVDKNLLISKGELKIESIKNNLQASKLKIDQIKIQIEQLSRVQDDIIKNQEFFKKTAELQKTKDDIELNNKTLDGYKSTLNTIVSNKVHIIKNKEINEKIAVIQQAIKDYKMMNFQVDGKLKESYGIIGVEENNVENYNDKLKQIKESVRIFNKYSIYLQAVSRDGIPAQIIKRRLPIVNDKISSVLSSIVNFKIELFVKPNGDVQEVFYFSEDKSDSLPLSMASGMQRFIGSVAIREALHYISCLVKPSFCIIDEGFDTMDEDKIRDVGTTLNYLKNKHKNVIIVTHRNEVKDYVDHIITVNKVQTGIAQSILDVNPDAGISQIGFS